MNKKICIISLKAYPLFNKACNEIFGGAEVQLFLLAQELVKYKNFDVNFIVGDYGQESPEYHSGITVIKSFQIKNSSLTKNIKFLRSFIHANADIYIQRTMAPASGIIAILCKLLRKQFIYMVAHDEEVDGTYRKNKGVLRALLANIVFKLADVVIVQDTTQKYLLYTDKGKNSFVIRSGYPINETNMNKDNYVLWVGRSEHWKRPELFIKLAKLNTDFKFKMICPQAFNHYAKKYSSLKQEAIEIENLEFIEYVPFDDIDEYFQRARIFINTSEKEGFPNTFVQATKNGTLIISLNVNPDNFLNEYNCGFFCDGDFSILNIKLNQISRNPLFYKEISENAYKYAKKNHDITKNARQLYDIIDEVLNAKK